MLAILNRLGCLKIVHGSNKFPAFPMTAEHHNFFFQIWNSFAFLCVVFLRFPWLREIDRELHTFQSNLNGIDSPVKFRKVKYTVS